MKETMKKEKKTLFKLEAQGTWVGKEMLEESCGSQTTTAGEKELLKEGR